MNSRLIAPEVWEQARQALVFYFCRRHGVVYAEDLAQDTLTAIWVREDFTFESPEQFLRVCYGFANRISLQSYRQAARRTGQPLNVAAASHTPNMAGLKGAEVGVFLDEVRRTGESGLSEKDWAIVQKLMEEDRSDLSSYFAGADAGNFRVQLHRIRRKLSLLTGWPTRGRKKV